jgi:hypothetical protein
VADFPLSLNKIKIMYRFPVGRAGLSTVNVTAFCLIVYPKCCIYNKTVTAYVYNMLMFDHGWLCFAPKVI